METNETNLEPKSGNKEKYISLALIILCFLTAVGNWLYGIKPKPSSSGNKTAFTFKDSLFSESADLGIINVEGPIMHGGGDSFSNRTASSNRIIRSIKAAEKDGVKGLLVKINSPGGTAAASDAIYRELMRVREKSKIKVVSTMGDVAASGGYYIASSSDIIFANASTITGSIGVIAQFTQLKDLLDKIGVSATTITSGKHKDIGSPFRKPTEEDKKIMQALIDETYDQFLDAVDKGRPALTKEEIRKLADGRIYTGSQALSHKLVDKLGSYSEAMEHLKTLTNLKKSSHIKDYSKPSINDFMSIIGAKFIPFNQTFSQAELLTKFNKIPLMLYM